MFSFKGQTEQERGGKGPKTVENGTIETSLNIEMTDKTFETADFSSSEKQVRFSMKTIRTPPASPKPSSTSRFPKSSSMQSPGSALKSIQTRQPSLSAGRKPIQENLQAIQAVENIKVNFLEKLDVLPESKA